MNLKERAEKLEAKYNEKMYLDGSGLKLIEAALIEVWNQAIDAAILAYEKWDGVGDVLDDILKLKKENPNG